MISFHRPNEDDRVFQFLVSWFILWVIIYVLDLGISWLLSRLFGFEPTRFTIYLLPVILSLIVNVVLYRKGLVTGDN